MYREPRHIHANPAMVTALRKAPDAHKYSHGHLLVLSGGPGRGGAARMAARAGLRVGAGLVTIGAPADAMAEHAAQLNAIMLRPVGEARALTEILNDRRINALCLGPGLHGDDVSETRLMVAAALGGMRATVLDADALSVFEDAPDTLFGMLHGNCVLTPHGGEFHRLFPDLHGRAKVEATREAAVRAGCVVLFKGPDTVIAAPDGRCMVHAAADGHAAPWLATAGAGDVLAGLIAGLMARGNDALGAASIAAYLHARAARAFGPGLIAEDLPEMIPQVLRDMGV